MEKESTTNQGSSLCDLKLTKGKLIIHIKEGKFFKNFDFMKKMDPYIKMIYNPKKTEFEDENKTNDNNGTKIQETQVEENAGKDPNWN